MSGTATCHGATENGQATRASAAPRSVRLASRGIRTTREISRFACAAACDIMTGSVDSKEAIRAGGLFSLALRARLDERISGEIAVLDDGFDDEDADPMAAEEARLMEQLNAIRRGRAAR